jgi:signal peptidase II
MQPARRALLTVFVLLTCVGCDQVTKGIARQWLAGSGAVSFLHDIFRLQYTENPGGFLSLGANMPENLRYWVFIIFVGSFLAGLLVFIIRSRKTYKSGSIALTLMLGGGIGNLIDRVCNEGRVIDFMILGIGPLRTGVFNVADMAVSLGSIWLLVHSIRTMERKTGVAVVDSLVENRERSEPNDA